MLAATLLALAAAGLHATWNFLVKTGEEQGNAAWGQFGFAAVLAWPVLAFVGLPGTVAAPYLAASTAVHTVYVFTLVRSYRHGDFSLAYPLARGSGALVAAIGGVVLLDDSLSAWSWVAIAIVITGVLLLVGRRIEGFTVAWALLTGALIGVYSLIDSAGARRTDGVQYGLTLMSCSALGLTIACLAGGRGPAFAASFRRAWPRYAVGGACTAAAYTMVLAAVRLAPVGYVAVLRESSVVIAALVGWLVLHERLGRRRVVAAAVILAGLVLLVASGV
jgi:drug/metabolite transporter (DMT)-like permease